MAKICLVTEKPSVAMQFASALKVKRGEEKPNGYIEGFSDFFNEDICITWAVGHLVSLLYPNDYDEKYKKWNLDDLPFLPVEYRYGVLTKTSDQFKVVKKKLNEADTIYNCGDSGREGEYIQRLIYTEAGVEGIKDIKRVWIDSQTTAEILRGIKNAKPESTYDKLSDAAYMRAIEDYAMGINFSRALTCKYGGKFNSDIKSTKYKPLSVGRVMTCVLGMVVEREREIKNFKETCFYKISADCGDFGASWKAVEGSKFFESPKLYNETRFLKKDDAEELVTSLSENPDLEICELERKDEKRYAPLLFNLAELQAECARVYKISPDETLAIAQKLYESKLTTYPRTDARVITTAIAAVIHHNLEGIGKGTYHSDIVKEILDNGSYKDIASTRYTDDSKVTDHYAIIPTGEGNLSGLTNIELSVYHRIIDRFLSIFMPPAVYKKTSAVLKNENGEQFFASTNELLDPGYLKVIGIPEEKEDKQIIPDALSVGDCVNADYSVKEGKTQPPKRYTTGTMVLAMENAGNLIEEEELREQIKGCGIGTSATRASTITKLIDLAYINVNDKTQVLTPGVAGEAAYNIVHDTLPDFLSPKMTANWERGLSQIEQGKIARSDYEDKLNNYITVRIGEIKALNNGKDFEGKPFVKKVVGKCPVCGSDVTNTKRGNWVCSNYNKDNPESCRFGISAVMCGKELTEEQMATLLKGGKTDLIKGFKKKKDDGSFSGKAYSAFLYYDSESQKIKLELPTAETNPGLGLCPNCGEKVLYGKYGAYCTGKCGMMLGKARGKTLSEGQVTKMLKGEKFLVSGLKNKEGKKYDAYLTPKCIVDFSYTKNDGTLVEGKQYEFDMKFPNKKKKGNAK